MKIWILFSVANDYNQPDRALLFIWLKIYWEEPTKEERKRVQDMNDNSNNRYWIEKFSK